MRRRPGLCGVIVTQIVTQPLAASGSLTEGEGADSDAVAGEGGDGSGGEVTGDGVEVGGNDPGQLGRAPVDESADEDHRRPGGADAGQQGTEVGVGRDEDAVLLRREGQDSRTWLSSASSAPRSRA